MLSGGKPSFPTCEFSYLDRLRVDGRTPQQNRAELIGLYPLPDPKLIAKTFVRQRYFLKTRSYGFALQKIAVKKSIGSGCRLGYGNGNLAVSRD
jgi:hypothetical protein